jgi:hypothetical protein
MKCAKRRYRDNIAALVALAKIQNRGETRGFNIPVRSYHCPRCKGWHLTHLTSWPPPK